MKRYLDFVDRFAWLVLAVLLSLTIFFALQLPKLGMDSNPYLLSEDHPARKTILNMQKEFTGTYDAVLIAIHNKDGIFNRITLDASYDLTQSSRRIILANEADRATLRGLAETYAVQSPEFQSVATEILKGGLEQNDYSQAESLRELGEALPLRADERAFLYFFPNRINPIKEMAGLAATENIVNREGTLIVHYSLNDKATSPQTVREEVMGNAMMVGGAVSSDEKVTLVVVELFIKQEDAEGQLRAYDTFRRMLDDYAAQHPEFLKENDVHIAGVPIFIAEQKKLMDRDLATLLPVVIGVVTTLLIVFFRRPLGVLLPLMNVVMSTVWTLGLMALLNVQMDLITSVLPVFLITICGADAIHMMSEYYAQRASGLTAREAVRRMMILITSPVILTTLTTVAGFLFSTTTNISSFRSFGIFMAIGLVNAQLISLLLLPAWLGSFGQGWMRPSMTGTAAGRHAPQAWLSNVLERCFRMLLKHRPPMFVAFVLVLAAFGYLATRIHVEDAGSSYFAESNQFRLADEFINSHIAGTSPGWISVGKPGERSMATLEQVAFIDKLDTFLESQPNVTYTYSLAKYVKRMNLVMHDMDPTYDRLPKAAEVVTSTDPEAGKGVNETIAGDDLVSQAILMYENGGGSELTNVMNREFSKAATLFTMNTTRASEYQDFLDKLDTWLKQNKPKDVNVVIGGTPVIWSGVLREIIKGQLTSFILALAAVTVVLILWLRSWRHGLLTALPLACTMIFYYGAMTLLDIDLNIGTAITSFLVVGIVDYSVHYLYGIKAALSEGLELDDALVHALQHSGRSIVFNVLIFSLGFLSLLASEFTPIIYLGGLVALALSVSGFMSLFLISLLAPVFFQAQERVEEQIPVPNRVL